MLEIKWLQRRIFGGVEVVATGMDQRDDERAYKWAARDNMGKPFVGRHRRLAERGSPATMRALWWDLCNGPPPARRLQQWGRWKNSLGTFPKNRSPTIFCGEGLPCRIPPSPRRWPKGPVARTECNVLLLIRWRPEISLPKSKQKGGCWKCRTDSVNLKC